MKINLNSIDREQFTVKEVLFCGVPAFLVNPVNMSCQWTKETVIYRSSIWDSNGYLLSAGLRKCWNETEKPELYPNPLHFNDWKVKEKKDGSLLIFDYINGQSNIRTRGTVNYASNFEDQTAITFLLEKYKQSFDLPAFKRDAISILFEFYDPNRKIVLDYGPEPKLWLIGIANKSNYEYVKQENVDAFALELGFERPLSYNFSTIQEIRDSLVSVNNFEGYCLYFNNDQNIIKLKSNSYLVSHRFKSSANLEMVVDLFCELNYPSPSAFREELIKRYDFECWNIVKDLALKVNESYEKAKELIKEIGLFVEPLKSLIRREAAFKILEKHGKDKFSSFCFKLLTNSNLEMADVKKLIFKVLES